MNITQLNYVITLANEKNYTKAANKLYITQPTLSQQIKQVELELDQQLFNRSYKEITLTPAGKIFYAYATQAVAQYERCLQSLRNINTSNTGSLAVGLFWTFGYNNIDQVIAKFKKTYPNIDLSLSVDGSKILIEKIIAQQLDCAFITGTYLPNDNEFNFLKKTINFRLITQSPLICLAHENSELARKVSLTFEDFDNQPVMYMSQLSNMYQVFDQCFMDSHAHPKIIGYTSQADVNLQVAQSNIGYSFTTLDTYNKLQHDHVKAIPLIPQLNRQIFLISHKKTNNNAIDLLENLI